MQQKAGLTLQRVLVLSYQSRVTETAAGLRVGPVSAHMSRYVPFMVAPREVYDITNEQAALHTHAVFGFLEKEVGHIEALMSTLVYSFWRYVEGNWEVICNDIEHGSLSTDLPAPNKQLESISRLFKPQPERANELRQLFAAGFDGISLRIWPELRFVRTLTTGGFALHAQLLSNYYMKGVKLLSLAHVASEGFIGFNISDNPDEQIYTAMPDYAFLEFIALSNTGLDQPKTQFLEELKLGGEYEVVMTTPMGLHRYRTGDIIKVVGFQEQTPIYEFQYRLGQILNIYWEKTDEAAIFESVSRALERLPRKDRVRLVDYTTTEDICMPRLASKRDGTQKHYYLFIEVEGANGEEIIMTDHEKAMFDGTLCEVSEPYSLIRQSESAAAMEVVQVKPGTFIQMKSTLILWTQNQQYKCPRVMRRPEFLKLLMDASC
ncbi:hypothetical protein CAPTEDRAFT_104502 [Capitella teleta]|uniref:GH3 domain-containing protein n=1 Tax=Capitella teleta TaxID=283909 RepID=R7UYQ9_CAPTE|nr:hypothetical protein CAPTEDRAFT_104502 [Capitella teleta]|eukprot:ELU11427.1 hypothetical protein CAPTEDRAFT_104502 [Capitella teleta]